MLLSADCRQHALQPLNTAKQRREREDSEEQQLRWSPTAEATDEQRQSNEKEKKQRGRKEKKEEKRQKLRVKVNLNKWTQLAAAETVHLMVNWKEGRKEKLFDKQASVTKCDVFFFLLMIATKMLPFADWRWQKSVFKLNTWKVSSDGSDDWYQRWSLPNEASHLIWKFKF